MLRLGLCCLFLDQPIRFRTTTATSTLRMQRSRAFAKISAICLSNASSLHAALLFCSENGIGAFRVNSRILPLKTHPEAGYDIHDLPDGDEIISRFRACRRFARVNDIRLSFHPDQFIVLNSPDREVVRRSVAELVYHAQVARWIGADVITIHAGGTYGDKESALTRLADAIRRLPPEVKKLLTLENDDRCFTPSDLLPLCNRLRVPLVYDVHHHRCFPDLLSVEQATRAALSTWKREPLFHISSPIDGWERPDTSRHGDYIAIADFPHCWRGLTITVDVEAKAKERAVMRLYRDLKLGLS